MIKKLKKDTVGVLMALAIIAPFMTHITVEASPLSEASTINSPLYSVTVPKEINLGELKETSYQSVYNLDVELLQPELGDVYIESPKNIILTNEVENIQVNSTLRNNGILESKEVKALFWLESTEITVLPKGEYVGNIDFTFYFRADETLDISKGNNASGRDTGMITNGFDSFVQNNQSGTVHNFIVDRLNKSGDEYLELINLSMEKAYDGNTESVVELDQVVEIRIPVQTLYPIDNREYKVRDVTTDKVLTKLAVRPEMGNYTDGQYFVTVDGVYLYTSSMRNIEIYEGEIEDGSYPSDVETAPEIEEDDDSEDIPNLVPNTSDSTSSNSGESDDLADTVAPDVSSGDGSYTADVSMRKSSDFSSLSMCDSLFYSKADIIFEGTDATVTLYVIDPIPAFPSTGTPLTNVKYMYKSSDYKANVSTANKEAKYFPSAAGFIDTPGNYYTSKIVTTIPKQAIADSANKGLMIEAYVNAVMESTQEFYIVFSNLSGGNTPTETDTSNIIDVDESETVDGNNGNIDDVLTNENVDSNSLADMLTNAILGAGIYGKAIVAIFGTIMTGLLGFFTYAYYLHRKKESGDV